MIFAEATSIRIRLSRRAAWCGICLLLVGCATAAQNPLRSGQQGSDRYASIYGPIVDGSNEIPALELGQMDHDLLRREVVFSGRYTPGTIVYSPRNHWLNDQVVIVHHGGHARDPANASKADYCVGIVSGRSSASGGKRTCWPVRSTP